jgi:hypothetical protein
VSTPPGTFADAVTRALAVPADGPLGARFPAALVTAIVAWAPHDDRGRLATTLQATIARLVALGVPQGRQYVLLGAGPDGRPAGPLDRDELGVPVIAHAPAGPAFVAGRTADGIRLEFSDELREAEALVVVGPAGSAGAEPGGGPFLLCPGVAATRTREAWQASLARGGVEAALAFALAAERALPVQLAVLWDQDGGVVAGGGRERFTAAARPQS